MFSRNFTYFQRRYSTLKYYYNTVIISFVKKRLYYMAEPYVKKYQPLFYLNYCSYFFLYSIVFFTVNMRVFYQEKKKKRKYKRVYYHLILTFRQGKLFLNINDYIKRNYFFISSGFFIKFFEKKKLYKKSKIVRSLLIKYLRKLFLLIRIPRLVLIVKNKPVNLVEFLKLLNLEIPHKFYEPLTNREIIDDGLRLTKFLYFIFYKNTSYVKNKVRKKGRIKRKIFRKLVRQNNLTD